jgi:hypothetical protein
MVNLRKLNLNYTDISPHGLSALGNCKQLQELSLSGTAVNGSGLEQVLSLPQLSELYIWDTKIDTTTIAGLRKKFNRVQIENGFLDDGSFKVALSSPLLDVNDSIFNPVIKLTMHHPYKGVLLKYTIDGSQPDSSHGEVYTGAIVLDSTVTLMARAFKKGWLGSLPSTATYIRAIRPDSAALISIPDSLYKKINPAILYDGSLAAGNLNSDDGQWFGYRNKEASYYFFYKKDTVVHQAAIYDLLQSEFDNFPPVKIEVWGGKTPRNLKLLGSVPVAAVGKDDLPRVLHQKLSFAPTTIRCLKFVAYPLRRMPEWSKHKGKPARLFISEILID